MTDTTQPKMIQYMVMTPPGQLAQIDALSIVRGVSRATIARECFDVALPQMASADLLPEIYYRIRRLDALALRQGVDLEEFIERVRRERPVARARSRRSMPTLEELEAVYAREISVRCG